MFGSILRSGRSSGPSISARASPLQALRPVDLAVDGSALNPGEARDLPLRGGQAPRPGSRSEARRARSARRAVGVWGESRASTATNPVHPTSGRERPLGRNTRAARELVIEPGAAAALARTDDAGSRTGHPCPLALHGSPRLVIQAHEIVSSWDARWPAPTARQRSCVPSKRGRRHSARIRHGPCHVQIPVVLPGSSQSRCVDAPRFNGRWAPDPLWRACALWRPCERSPWPAVHRRLVRRACEPISPRVAEAIGSTYRRARLSSQDSARRRSSTQKR